MTHYLHRILRDPRKADLKIITLDVLILDDDLDVFFCGRFTGREDSRELKVSQWSGCERIAAECGARPEGFEWKKLPTDVAKMLKLCQTFDGYTPMPVQYRDKIQAYLAPVHRFLSE